MLLDAIRQRLDACTAASEPGAERFDDGPPLEGRYAVLSSAFNPPTVAHLRMLALAAALPHISGTAALLTTLNVDKGLYGASLEHRVAMLLAVRAERPHPAVLATNVPRFVDQAAALGAGFPHAAFDFIVGHDTLVRIFDARYYADMPAELAAFFAGHRLIATNRGLAGIDEVVATLGRDEAARFANRITVLELDGEAAAISSSAARHALAAEDHSPELPESVRRYIARHALYREPERPVPSGLFGPGPLNPG